MFFLGIVYGLCMSITDNSFSKGTLVLTITEPGILKLSFPYLLYPYLHPHKDDIIKLEKRNKHLNVFIQVTSNIAIKYVKHINNIHEYGWKVERGIIIPRAILYNGKGLIFSNALVDMIYVPDFTVPFLAFNTCGAVFTIIFSLYVKKNIKRRQLRRIY